MMLFPPQRPLEHADVVVIRPANAVPVGRGERSNSPAQERDRAWPPEADLILSAIEAGRAAAGCTEAPATNRRRGPRTVHRIQAELRLFSDLSGTEPWLIYTRDVDGRGMGFLSQRRLPLGQSGTVYWTDGRGKSQHAYCTVCRCREAVQGWFEGAIHFG